MSLVIELGSYFQNGTLAGTELIFGSPGKCTWQIYNSQLKLHILYTFTKSRDTERTAV